MISIFSVNEEKVLKILGSRTMTLKELTDEFFEGDPPFEANNRVGFIIRRIENKCDHHNLNWTIASRGTGRRGKTVWKEKRDNDKR